MAGDAADAALMHLAEFNIGVLKHDWDDRRVRGFVDGLALVNAVAARSPGFVWRLPDAEMERAQLDPAGPLDGHPRAAATLSVWETPEALEHFVWNTVHKRFHDRKAEWFEPTEQRHFTERSLRLVMWWIPVGHRPDIAEAFSRLKYLDLHGESEHAFGWRHLRVMRSQVTGAAGPE